MKINGRRVAIAAIIVGVCGLLVWLAFVIAAEYDRVTNIPADRATGVGGVATACTDQGHRLYYIPHGGAITAVADPACEVSPVSGRRPHRSDARRTDGGSLALDVLVHMRTHGGITPAWSPSGTNAQLRAQGLITGAHRLSTEGKALADAEVERRASMAAAVLRGARRG